MGGEGGGTRPGLRPASGGLAFLPTPPAPAPVESGALTKPRPDLAGLKWPSRDFPLPSPISSDPPFSRGEAGGPGKPCEVCQT